MDKETQKQITGDITPLPWKFDFDEIRNDEYLIALMHCAPSYRKEAEATAKYIVKACNLFPELIEVLENFTNDIIKDRYGELSSHGYSEEEILKMICNGDPLLKKAKELLSKVKQ
jgi:hypothetical protein